MLRKLLPPKLLPPQAVPLPREGGFINRFSSLTPKVEAKNSQNFNLNFLMIYRKEKVEVLTVYLYPKLFLFGFTKIWESYLGWGL